MLAASGDGIALMGNSDAFFRMAPYVVETIARENKWNYTPEPRSAGSLLILIDATRGTAAALTQFERMKHRQLAGFRLDEGALNALGYQLLSRNRVADAISVLELNVAEYPKSWNCYDSLAEAYARAGQTGLAIENYERSLTLNPQNENGAEALKKLRARD
jgi:tetratricopeptide (TPR) repeat protein